MGNITLFRCPHCGKELLFSERQFMEKHDLYECSECRYLHLLGVYTIQDYNNYLLRSRGVAMENYVCPHCNAENKVKPRKIGRLQVCPNCGHWYHWSTLEDYMRYLSLPEDEQMKHMVMNYVNTIRNVIGTDLMERIDASIDDLVVDDEYTLCLMDNTTGEVLHTMEVKYEN